MIRRPSRRSLVRGLAALAASPAIGLDVQNVYAQQPASPRRVGILRVDSAQLRVFQEGLRDLGYVEGRDVVVESRIFGLNYDRVPELVADLMQRKVEVIVVVTTVAAQAAKRATSTIPIVMAIVADPIGSGLVANLVQPGGNVTGLSSMTIDLAAKRLQLLKEMLPQIRRVAVLWNPDTPYHPKVVEDIKAAALALSIELTLVNAQTPEQIVPVFSAVGRARAQAIYIIEDPFFYTRRKALVELASRAQLPAICGERSFADAGALMSYGTNLWDLLRRSTGYVDKIIKGAKAADLPIEQPTKFEMVVNLKTAKALGITIPQAILMQADEVIR